MKEFCVVTGANAGIGLEVTAGLRQKGNHVVMACRSLERCAVAKAELDTRQLPGSCECAELDLADLGSIRAFASHLSSRGQQVRTLVNNAGVMGVGPGSDGTNAHLPPNHYGPFLLTRLLLPLMAAHGRIVTVGSEAHRRLRLNTSKPSLTAGELGRTSKFWYVDYGKSKLANLLMTSELSRRLQARDSTVSAYCVSPGRVKTNIFSNVPDLLRRPIELVAGLFFQTPEQGAQTVLHAAQAPELRGKHVLYIHHLQETEPSATANDAGLAADLWQCSVQAVGLSKADDDRLWPRV